MIPFFVVLLICCFGSLVLQHFIPPLPFLEGARVYLMPLVFFYGALSLPFSLMLLLAFCCGLMWDALTTLVYPVKGVPTVELMVGFSVILFAVLGAVMSGFRPLFQRGRWEVHCLMSGVCTAAMLLTEFVAITVRRAAVDGGGFFWAPEIAWRIGGAGLVAMVLAPVVFFVLSFLARLVGYDPRQMEREEE